LLLEEIGHEFVQILNLIVELEEDLKTRYRDRFVLTDDAVFDELEEVLHVLGIGELGVEVLEVVADLAGPPEHVREVVLLSLDQQQGEELEVVREQS